MRWNVVDKDRTPIFTSMASKTAAEDEARVLNEEGLEEFRPYTVVAETILICCCQTHRVNPLCPTHGVAS